MGDRVFIKVVSFKHMIRFNRKGKLTPKFIGLYEIVERVSKVTYTLVLSVRIDRIHSMFHVLSLQKYISYPLHVLRIEEIQLFEDLSYKEKPI